MYTFYLYTAKYLIFITPIFLLYYIYTHDNFKKAIKESIIMAIVSALGWVFANTLKNILKIPRPEVALDVLFKNESLYSFPSGHITFFFTLATIMFFYHRKISYLLFFLGALVGFCRVMIGVHYPVDIFGGAVLGILVGFILHNIKMNFLEKYF